METTLNITLLDVKRAIGLLDDNTAYDTFIEERIRAVADLLIEDWFTSIEFSTLTPNQKRRAVEGLALLIGSDCLLVMPVNAVMSSGSSISVGPLSVAGWSGGRNLSDLRRTAFELKKRGEDILKDLRLTGYGEAMEWLAVGTVKRPTYVGGPRW